MKRWRAYAVVRGTKYIGEFEAEHEDTARDMAVDHENSYVSLCHQCSRECEDIEVEEYVLEEIEDKT